MKNTAKLTALTALFMIGALALAPLPAAAQDESLDAILKALQTYDTSDVGPAMRLHAYVFAHKDDAAARKAAEAALLKFVQGAPSPAGLMAACRSLSLIGGPDAVPVLAALVLDAGTTDAARYALERIPGPEADQALVKAVDLTQGQVRRGVISSLGTRRAAAAAIPALTRSAQGRDPALAADAVRALGRTGGPEAVKALTALLPKAPAALKPEIASALLDSAENALAAGDEAAAASIYDKVFAANVTVVSRQAAFKGRLALGPDVQGAILKALGGKDPALTAPALALVPAHFGPGEIGRVADLMPGLPLDAQVQLVAILAKYPSETVRPTLLAAAESPAIDVRLAALRALTWAGDGKSVLFLANKAAKTAGAEQDAAREALARMKGLDVDAAVLEHLGKPADDAVKAELVAAASARRIAGAKPALMGLVAAGSPSLEVKAAAALRTLSVQADIPALLDLLGGLGDEGAREAMEDTVAAVARTNPRELARSGEVKARLGAEKDPRKRADLLRVLGKIGDDSALAMVRAAVADPDAVVVDGAVRALADWPTVSARDDVFEIARTSLVLNHRVLATRASIRMVGLEPYRAPEGAAADLLKVLALSPRPEEKKLVLGLLPRFSCVTSLKTAESLLSDPTVAEEAKLAADRIRKSLK